MVKKEKVKKRIRKFFLWLIGFISIPIVGYNVVKFFWDSPFWIKMSSANTSLLSQWVDGFLLLSFLLAMGGALALFILIIYISITNPENKSSGELWRGKDE